MNDRNEVRLFNATLKEARGIGRMYEMRTFLSIINKLGNNFLSMITFKGTPSTVKAVLYRQVLCLRV
jgi:hypothetical protein